MFSINVLVFDTWKIMRSLDREDVERMFAFEGESRIRSHCLKVEGCPLKTGTMWFIFSEGYECLEFVSSKSKSEYF